MVDDRGALAGRAGLGRVAASAASCATPSGRPVAGLLLTARTRWPRPASSLTTAPPAPPVAPRTTCNWSGTFMRAPPGRSTMNGVTALAGSASLHVAYRQSDVGDATTRPALLGSLDAHRVSPVFAPRVVRRTTGTPSSS